jgi:hypothetical protein
MTNAAFLYMIHRIPEPSLPPVETVGSTPYIALKLEHVLIAIGFSIGFCMVFCVAIIYYKFQPMRRFKMLDNQQPGKSLLDATN